MRWKVLLFSALFFCAISTYAQFKASIQGTVMDPQGEAVASAKVTVTNQATGATRDMVTSAEGFYRINELPPGNYTITVEATGFKQSVSRNIAVEAEQPRGFDVTLAIGAVQESVIVSAPSGGLETENANVNSTIGSR